MKNFPENLAVIEWTCDFANWTTLENVAMFNTTVISEAEVTAWIKKGMYNFETNPKIVIMTKEQYKNLFDVATVSAKTDSLPTEEDFYEDLAQEQKDNM